MPICDEIVIAIPVASQFGNLQYFLKNFVSGSQKKTMPTTQAKLIKNPASRIDIGQMNKIKIQENPSDDNISP